MFLPRVELLGGSNQLQSPASGRRPRSRVLRGGSFNNNAHNVRSAYRNNNNPDNRNNNIGFRVASTLRQTIESATPESAGRIHTGLPCGVCQV